MIVVILLFAWLKVAKWVVECGFSELETGVFVVGFTDLYVGFWGLEFGLMVSELGSEGLNWGFGGFVFVFGFCVLDYGDIGWRSGGFWVGFLYVSLFVRRKLFANVVFAVGDMAKVWFRVPKWLRFMGFARWVLAVANRVRRVGSGFNRAFHLENGCSDCKNGVFVFRFLYFSGLVRRNSFVNVVFAVGECGVAG